MNPEDFIKQYTTALSSQKWSEVEPLITKEAIITFSNGSVHKGKEQIKIAFEYNFAQIKNENYTIKNVIWLRKEESYAVYTYEFSWSGIMKGKTISGNGNGTTVLVKKSENWKLLTEHIGRKA